MLKFQKFRLLPRLLLVILLFHCSQGAISRSQCYEEKKCSHAFQNCFIKYSIITNPSLIGVQGPIQGLPTINYPPSNPIQTNETESDDTFFDAFNNGNLIQSNPFDSNLMQGNLSSSSDTDIYALEDQYEISIYFKTQGSASCSIYWQNFYNLFNAPHTNVPDSNFTYVGSLSTSPLTMEIPDTYSNGQGGGYVFICSGGSAGTYSIQTDPGQNAKQQYIIAHHLVPSSGSTINPIISTLNAETCSSAETNCKKGCSGYPF